MYWLVSTPQIKIYCRIISQRSLWSFLGGNPIVYRFIFILECVYVVGWNIECVLKVHIGKKNVQSTSHRRGQRAWPWQPLNSWNFQFGFCKTRLVWEQISQSPTRSVIMTFSAVLNPSLAGGSVKLSKVSLNLARCGVGQQVRLMSSIWRELDILKRKKV